MNNRRARPTLRVLRQDLTSDWKSPSPKRALEEGRLDALHPLSEQPHPIVEKALQSFGTDSADDNFVRPISSSSRLRLLEIKQSQWRGGVWQDPDSGICWLVVAGIAKGNHQDTDDFYEVIKRVDESGDPDRWLPTEEDQQLLKRETAARLRTEWEIDIQRAVLEALKIVHTGGTHRIEINHTVPAEGHFASVDITVTLVRKEDFPADEEIIEADEILVEVFPKDRKFPGLFWQLIIRLLTSIEPPEQSWDTFGNTYSNIGDLGAWTQRIQSLSELVDSDRLAVSAPGNHSHYTHKKHLAGKTLNGNAAHTLCGVYFVPMRDHESFPTCPTCQSLYSELPTK